MSRSQTPIDARDGLSLVELVVAMGLLAIIMLPTITLIATSTQVYKSSVSSQDGSYIRQIAVDAVTRRLEHAQRIVSIRPNSLTVLTTSGSTARLSYSAGRLTWREGRVSEVLVQGLSSALQQRIDRSDGDSRWRTAVAGGWYADRRRSH